VWQRIAFKRLIKRNTERKVASQAKGTPEADEPKIPLPFIIINTNSQTIIQCEMTEDRSDVFFNFRYGHAYTPTQLSAPLDNGCLA
jgi:hypothetical protein